MGKPKRNRMQMEIDNEPTSPPKPMNIDKWSISSQERKGADNLLHKIKKKPKPLRAKAKKRREQGIKRALNIKEKEEIKIAKSLEKLNKKKRLKSIQE
ncbi:hypothetical protein RhiirA5_349828 [Rhizophagus irregularis]|uniref:Uncharacterized protein n=3 Tax=Rhizophagus irregularis TaxID=588596 RepID=U9T1J6_RHIID|nr:hypothetical protein GLOIN_2v1771025 [Rhizophagus irregularis DAOM 181602=DAOM 197198]PKC14827.1 hypothetical protein RhiirA5_349828 [Rhizophagus irregularis]RGB29713.1 hypothetical protein C1646_818341 [Rhizophagus diaphanus] [Rhizophagus sp. MUCL 43196]PKC68175.1 hypothetical protein RhiirA1_417165 [Rhizophagus irregularis]PKK76211.1 hypothetical protein RhiirC2_734870 [Rhizophagus irregularis]PKY13440.1 hypothetical protein RhiirB3_398846 [Rhizophagus irregularis]|eukprot:XP_025181629.1 hypothetical protein GLOIN_2v1771025 [Rhizophagus irregularis DAOM 181602=DAOM 197198]